MGMTEDFEISLQVLRGFETDISVEVNEIKVPSILCAPRLLYHVVVRTKHPQSSFRNLTNLGGRTQYQQIQLQNWYLFVIDSYFLVLFTVQRSVASSSRRTAIRFGDLKQRRYWFPLMVILEILFFLLSFFFQAIKINRRNLDTNAQIPLPRVESSTSYYQKNRGFTRLQCLGSIIFQCAPCSYVN